MPTAADMRVADLLDKYKDRPAPRAYSRLYEDVAEFGHMLAVLHDQLNRHFSAINERAKTKQNYWAERSRELLALIEELRQDLHSLSLAGFDVNLLDSYELALEDAETWLMKSNGSPIPDDYKPVEILRYDQAFSFGDKTIRLKKESTPLDLKMVGSGSYANVYSYVDPDYGVKYAVKRAKRGIDARDQHRFRQEFDVMKALSFPYVVQVFKFNETRNEYGMEFCGETLRQYVQSRNTSLSFSTRKRIALQFLYGLNYIHTKGLLHRDISLQNVLLKIYDSEAVLVKLSDFGLVKDKSSEFTRTQTEMRGTIRDPMLHDFKSYDLVNEMWAAAGISDSGISGFFYAA
ncbi:protein kinase family protein, partial [Arthrobacter sp. AL12]|uniref:protein kinase family protein n=1 Tax=Arthrobacter sp. AL12 TaxID=3042241 RepID=UPI00249A462C